MRRTVLSFTTLLAATMVGRSALAQVDPAVAATRRGLITEAERAREAGDHAHALDLATRAGELEMTPSLRWLMAQEYTALGRFAEALGSADLCVREASAGAAIVQRERVLGECRAMVTSLQQRVGRVVVRVPTPPPAELRITVGGRPLPQVVWDAPFVVTPGSIQIEALSPSTAPVQRVVEVAAAQTAEVSLTFRPAAAPEAHAVVAPPTTPAPPTPEAPAPPLPAPQRVSSGPGVAPWIVVALGGASLGVSLTFLVLQQVALADADRIGRCDATGCDPAGRPFHDRAVDDTTVANITLATGIAGVGAGVLWYLLARPGRRAAAQTAWLVAPAQDGVSLGLRGSF